MKLGLIVFASAMLGASAAYAAVPTASDATPWTGGYAGVYVGGSSSATNMQEINGVGELAFLPGQITSAHLNHNTFDYGGYAGYNYQLPASPLVAGGEVEFGGSTGSTTGVTNSGVIPAAPAIEDNIPTYNKLTLPWTFRGRVRLGYAFGNVLPFVAGGVSVTKAQLDLTFPCPNFPTPGTTVYIANSSKTVTGFNIGAGVDWAMSRHIVARAEYVFDDYGSPGFAEDGSQGWNDRRLANLHDNTVRVAAAYKF